MYEFIYLILLLLIIIITANLYVLNRLCWLCAKCMLFVVLVYVNPVGAVLSPIFQMRKQGKKD